MELLRGDVVRLAHELGDDRDPLPRGTDRGRLEKRRDLCGRRHLPTVASGENRSQSRCTLRNVLRIVLIPVAGLMLLAGCGAGDAGGTGTQVVAAFYPLAFAAEQIAGSDATVAEPDSAGRRAARVRALGRRREEGAARPTSSSTSAAGSSPRSRPRSTARRERRSICSRSSASTRATPTSGSTRSST